MRQHQIYASHPLRRETILDRLRRAGRMSRSSRISEWDLAIDPDTDLTDQNHSGGVQAVLELASAAGVTSTSSIVDVGAGLGGPARVLATCFGCKVLGVEFDPTRCADCAELTALIGLEGRVQLLNRDAMQGPVPEAEFDVLWGQSAWGHLEHWQAFLDLWLPALTTSGRIAFSDSYLARDPATGGERALVDALQESWQVTLVPHLLWVDHLHARDFRITHHRDRTAESLAHFERLLGVSAEWPAGIVTDFEVAGWRRAIAAIRAGLIHSVRTVACRNERGDRLDRPVLSRE